MTDINTKTSAAVNSIEELEAVCALCRDTNEAVPVTAAGNSMVLMTKEQYDELEFELFKAQLESRVYLSSLDVERGNFTKSEVFFKEMREKYGL